MRTKTYKTEAIVLKRKNFSEADKILTLYSKHYGKISCIAKGIRKLTSRKAASLELFNHVVLFLAKGKNLDIITEATLISGFPNFRKDLKKVKIAYEACEVVEKLTVEEKGNDLVFLKLKDFLYELEKTDANSVILESKATPESKGKNPGQASMTVRGKLRIFKKEILEILGFGLPKDLNSESLNNYIESIIEKKLVVGKLF